MSTECWAEQMGRRHNERYAAELAEIRRLRELEQYLKSGNDVPVTRATIPWPGLGMVTIDAIRSTRK